MKDVNVPAGYKSTDIGVIPEDWELKHLGDITDIKVGRDVKKNNFSTYKDNEYKYPVFSNTVDDKGLYGFYNIKEYYGDSLTVVGRGIGLGTAFTRYGGYGAIGRLLVLFPNKDVISSFLTNYINHKLDIFKESSGIPQLTGIQIAKYKIPLPPLPEQKAIARVLSDVDELIRECDSLLAKKRDIKQGIMQQLFTGKKRLPGFSGEWEEIKLRDVLKVKHGKSQHHIVNENGKYPILATGGQIGKTNTFLYDKPSVLIGRKGTIDVPQYTESPFWTIDTLFYTEIYNKAIPEFIFYKFNLINWYSYNEASGVPSLNAYTIENIDSYFPPTLPEQKAIAQILSDMDAEIEALEQKRDKYKAIKQGMMQELLTGKTRLIENG